MTCEASHQLLSEVGRDAGFTVHHCGMCGADLMAIPPRCLALFAEGNLFAECQLKAGHDGPCSSIPSTGGSDV